MKTNAVLFIAIVCISLLYSFGQHTASIGPIVDKDKEGVIVAYRVEETIHLISGNRVTTYEVSKLEMVNNYDLGPNNTREVIPIYRKPKVKPAETESAQKVINDSVSAIIKPLENEIAAPLEEERYVMIDIVSTYAKIVDKGYKSEDMLKKVADKSYFESNFESAVKYYSQLIDINENVDPVYYYRYAVSLKASHQIDKAEEIMKLFESKNFATKLDRK